MSELFPAGRPNDRVGDFSRFDAQRLEASLEELVAEASGDSWYDSVGSTVDLAVARLCLLRRAKAGERASTAAGDDAVRQLLERAEPAAIAWLLTRAISYMDEQGFPDFVPGARIDG
jgi:hypothetical protein